MSGAIVVYVIYIVLALLLITWLAMTLQRYGRVFLDDVFASQTAMAQAASQLLVSGFLVFTMGYALLLLRVDPTATTTEAVRSVTRQFGLLLLSLGLLHSLNMLVLLQFRKRWGQRPDDRRRRSTRR